MPRSYIKVEHLTDEVFRRKAAGESNREIGKSFGLTKEQVEQLVARQRRKERKVAQGYILRPKGRPKKDAANESVRQQNELVQLRMQVELLRHFLSEVGRR